MQKNKSSFLSVLLIKVGAHFVINSLILQKKIIYNIS